MVRSNRHSASCCSGHFPSANPIAIDDTDLATGEVTVLVSGLVRFFAPPLPFLPIGSVNDVTVDGYFAYVNGDGVNEIYKFHSVTANGQKRAATILETPVRADSDQGKGPGKGLDRVRDLEDKPRHKWTNLRTRCLDILGAFLMTHEGGRAHYDNL